MDKLSGDMGHGILPGRLDQLIDNVNPGTVLKHLVEHQRFAYVIDFSGYEPKMWAVEVKKKIRDGDKLPHKSKHYRIFEVRGYEEWLVLALGNDILLAE